MPLSPTSVLPEEKAFPIIKPECYEVVLDDVEEEIKPSMFKNPDGSPQEDQHQYKIKLVIQDEGEFKDSWLYCWVRPSLRATTKSKRPTLPQLLLAITGKNFGPENRTEVTGEFMNSFIGASLRVTTQTVKSENTGKEYAVVVSFLPSKK